MRVYNNRKRVISAVLTASMLLALPVTNYVRMPAFASSAKDIKRQAEEDLKNTNDNINNIEDKKEQVENDLDDAGAELESLLGKQKKLKAKIDKTQQQVDQANADLIVAQRKEDEEYESMKLRIQFMYENSADDSLWSAILESSGISDMLNRIEYITDVYKSDRKLLSKYQNTVQQVKDLTKRLNEEMDGLLTMQADYESQQREVETLIASLNDKKDKYADQIAAAQEQAREYQATIDKQAEIIRRQEAEAARRALEEERRRQAAAAAAARAQEQARQQQQASNSSSESGTSGGSSENSSSQEDEYEGGGAGSSGLADDASLTDPGNDPEFTGSVSGSELVDYALQFVGGPYRWGGNSLTNGCDCSGFVHLVYKHFGYDLPRYSQSFKTVGRAVSYSNIKAGDIVVYPGHVAICIGNGCIVEAQSTRAGITSNRSVDCHTITAIRRVL